MLFIFLFSNFALSQQKDIPAFLLLHRESGENWLCETPNSHVLLSFTSYDPIAFNYSVIRADVRKRKLNISYQRDEDGLYKSEDPYAMLIKGSNDKEYSFHFKILEYFPDNLLNLLTSRGGKEVLSKSILK